MKIPDKGRKPVINCLFLDNGPIQVSLYQSLFILDNSESKPVDNAVVMISDNHVDWETLTNTNNGLYLSNNISPLQGKTYYIKAWVSGTEATAITKIPYKVDFQIKDTSSHQFDNQEWFQIKVGLSDPHNDTNYYMIRIDRKMLGGYYNEYYPVDITSQDPSFQNYWKSYLVFDDQLFNGQNKTFPIDISKEIAEYGTDSVIYKISLFSIPRDLYLYAKTSQAQLNSGNSPFSEPVMVYNNVNNGYGIFAGMSFSTDSIIITTSY